LEPILIQQISAPDPDGVQIGDALIVVRELNLDSVLDEAQADRLRLVESEERWRELSPEDQEAILSLLGRCLMRIMFRLKTLAPLCILTGEEENLGMDFRFRVLWSDVDVQRLKTEQKESMVVEEAVNQLRSSLKEFDVRSRETR
jgi:hypothetical protein